MRIAVPVEGKLPGVDREAAGRKQRSQVLEGSVQGRAVRAESIGELGNSDGSIRRAGKRACWLDRQGRRALIDEDRVRECLEGLGRQACNEVGQLGIDRGAGLATGRHR